jgi:hypothetical protein
MKSVHTNGKNRGVRAAFGRALALCHRENAWGGKTNASLSPVK